MVAHLVSTQPLWQAFVKESPSSSPEGRPYSQDDLASVAVAPHPFCSHLCTRMILWVHQLTWQCFKRRLLCSSFTMKCIRWECTLHSLVFQAFGKLHEVLDCLPNTCVQWLPRRRGCPAAYKMLRFL